MYHSSKNRNSRRASSIGETQTEIEKTNRGKAFWRGSSSGRRSGIPKEDIKTLKYLATLAAKYNIDSTQLLDLLSEALEKEKVKMGRISIKLREKSEGSAVFLFLIGEDVIAQFPISIKSLQEKDRLERYVNFIHTSKNTRVDKLRIKDLKVGMKGVSLKVQVLEIPKSRKVYTRYGTECFVANVLVGDRTGKTRLSLWNNQINNISPGDVIEIENGAVITFQGKLQLRIGKKGRLKIKSNHS